MKSVALVAALVAACSQPAPVPTKPGPPGGSAASAPADAEASQASQPSQDERLAAIQKAMNELDEAAQGCWAAAATDRFDIEGGVSVMIDIGQTASKATLVEDRTRNAKLTGCLVQLLEKYRWAPPLYGQSIQLPFNFKAPDGQSVIDRRLVDVHGQNGDALQVLIDEHNSGNAAASMLAVKTTSGWRKAERAELWYFLEPSKVNTGTLDAGDMLYVPAGVSRSITTNAAVLILVPGGAEGTARAGALPTPAASDKPDRPVVTLRAKDAKTFGPATIYLDSATTKGAPLAASILQLAAGAKVPEHVHEHETEMLYVLEGAGTMTIAGQDIAITPTSVIQIPPNTKHAFTATAAVRSLQIYTPGGPEQRFKKKP